MGTAIKHPVSDRVIVIFDIWMSKITNDSLTWTGIGYFIVVPTWQKWASKG